MSVMKQVVLNLSQRRYGDEALRTVTSSSGSPRTTRAKTSLRTKQTLKTTKAPGTYAGQPEHEDIPFKPAPTEFVSVQL